jgi:hypothetical protein
VSQLDHQLKNAMTALSDKNSNSEVFGAKTPPSIRTPVRSLPSSDKPRRKEKRTQAPQTTKLTSLPKAIVLYNFAAQYPEELSIVRVVSLACFFSFLSRTRET